MNSSKLVGEGRETHLNRMLSQDTHTPIGRRSDYLDSHRSFDLIFQSTEFRMSAFFRFFRMEHECFSAQFEGFVMRMVDNWIETISKDVRKCENGISIVVFIF